MVWMVSLNAYRVISPLLEEEVIPLRCIYLFPFSLKTVELFLMLEGNYSHELLHTHDSCFLWKRGNLPLKGVPSPPFLFTREGILPPKKL